MATPPTKKPARTKKNKIELHNKTVDVYASPKISTAITTIIGEMPLYEGVKIIQVMEALYDQGKKDGARDVIDNLNGKVKEIEKAIPHRNPGKPKKK